MRKRLDEGQPLGTPPRLLTDLTQWAGIALCRDLLPSRSTSGGAALTRYNLAATEKELAEQEARQYLEQHPVIEVWSGDHRRVARIVRK
jgi:hypothetical protein